MWAQCVRKVVSMLPEEPAVVGVETRSDNLVYVLASGRLGWDADTRIKEKLAAEAGDTWRSRTVVLSLAEVRFLDSAGISALLLLGRELCGHGGKLVFCEPPPRIRQMFELVGMDRLVPVVDDLKHAGEGSGT